MTSPVRTEKLSKTYEVRARKGLFKSEKRSVEALKGVSLEVKQGEIFGLPPLGYYLYRRAENYARKHGSLATY